MGGGWDKYKKSVYIELDLDNAISVYSHQQNTCNFFQIYRIKPKKIYLPVYETSNLKINHNIGITCTCHKGRLCLLATSFIKQNNLISV